MNQTLPFTLLVLASAIFLGLTRADDKGEWEKFPDGSVGQVTEYKGVKDTPIAAYLRKPKGDGPFPVVVMVHGGGDSKQGTYALGRLRTAPTANFLAEGWAVYSIDFRPKAPFQPIEWDDACLAVETVKKLLFIDRKRVAMIGGSHGGYNTARVASRCDLSCAIPCAPAAIDLIEVFKAKQAGFKLSPNLERVLTRKEQELGASMPEIMKDPAKFQWESSLTEAAKVRCPILLISGRNDASSPPSVMETYAKRLKDAGKEVELYLPDNGPHGFYFGRPALAETDEAARRAVAFIRKHFSKPDKASQPAQRDVSAAHKWVDGGAAEKTTAKTFRSDTIKGDVSYVIYLPPSYDKDKDRRYPVVFWLHGGRGSQRDCGKFVEVTDQAIRAGKCPEMLIVGVNGLGGSKEFPGSQYSDWKDGSLPMESVLVKDLLPHLDKTYRTLGTRESRAVEGFSMGGHGALHLAFRHPDQFGVVTAIGPALIRPGDGGQRVQWVYEKGAYKGDQAYWRTHDPLTVAEKDAEKIRGKLFIRLITGEVEGNFTHRRTVELSKTLEKLKIEHEFVRPGETGHNYVKVYEAMPKGYEFYGKAFGKLTPKTKEPPAPPVCYDITKTYPGEIGQYRVSRTAQPVEPFEIMDGLYYVGNTQVSAHLLKTTNGLILIDTTMPHEVPWLLDGLGKLGFQPGDAKVVIGTHAHLDHIGGHWYFQKHFRAQTWLQVEDAADTVRAGDWKLLEYHEDSRVELYNLKDDLGEATDVAAKMPEKAAELRRRLQAWRKDVGAQMPVANPDVKHR